MNPKTRYRLIIILIIAMSSGGGIYLILYNLNENITFFYPPSKVSATLENKIIRVGGFVVKGSIINVAPGKIKFTIVDEEDKTLNIYFQGIPPALFREEQTIVASGKLIDNLFIATEILAKHDENYYPPGTKPRIKP